MRYEFSEIFPIDILEKSPELRFKQVVSGFNNTHQRFRRSSKVSQPGIESNIRPDDSGLSLLDGFDERFH